jgi:hypothetical protein
LGRGNKQVKARAEIETRGQIMQEQISRPTIEMGRRKKQKSSLRGIVKQLFASVLFSPQLLQPLPTYCFNHTHIPEKRNGRKARGFTHLSQNEREGTRYNIIHLGNFWRKKFDSKTS